MKTKIGKSLFLKDIFNFNFWFVLGGPSSWKDENNPPNEVNSITKIDNPLVCLKTIQKLVKINENGNLKYGGMKLNEISLDQVFNVFPDYIYLEYELSDNILDSEVYWRQTGIYANIEVSDLSKSVFYPYLNEILDFGYLISYQNHLAKNIEIGQYRKIISLIEI